jgi:hypothetical protein
MKSGLWIGGRKIMRHPREFWWIHYARHNHIWIVRRWLHDRGLRFDWLPRRLSVDREAEGSLEVQAHRITDADR